MRRGQDGFTLVEIVVSLAIFTLIVVGAISVLGASNLGGFGDSFPTAFGTGRAAKDITAASVSLQAFQEYVASQGSIQAVNGTYTCVPPGLTCTPALPGTFSSAPAPTAQSYELNWTQMVVLIETWNWDATNLQYCLIGSPGCLATATTDALVRVRSTLTWQSRTTTRSLTVERFIP